METGFVRGEALGPAEFSEEPWYNPHGDCIVCQIADEAVVADRVDGVLTIYRSAIDNRPIGFQIKGVAALTRKFGWDGLVVQSQSCSKTQELESVSIAVLLLAAYESGPGNVRRRLAYASAMDSKARYTSINRRDLVPA